MSSVCKQPLTQVTRVLVWSENRCHQAAQHTRTHTATAVEEDLAALLRASLGAAEISAALETCVSVRLCAHALGLWAGLTSTSATICVLEAIDSTSFCLCL